MSKRQPMLFLSSTLMAMTLLISCGAPWNPPPPKWTMENSSASTGGSQASAQKPPAETKVQASSISSLEALRSGEGTTTPASSGLKDAYFAFDQYELSAAARDALNTNAEWLKANPAIRVEIEGHCDERGTEDYNMALGAKRAQTAMDYLATKGIAANRLSTISYGKEIPVCNEATEQCWAKNRRARFVVVSAKPTS